MAKGLGKGKTSALECCAVCGTAAVLCLTVLIVLTLIGLGIAKIVIGSVYIHDCSLQKLVPIYLIVSGVMPLLFGGFGKREEDSDSSSSKLTCGNICGMIGFLFNVAWLICGTYWVYPTYAKVHSHHFVQCNGTNPIPGCAHGDCKRVLIDFAFAMVTMDWIFSGLWIVLILFLIVAAFRKKSDL